VVVNEPRKRKRKRSRKRSRRKIHIMHYD